LKRTKDNQVKGGLGSTLLRVFRKTGIFWALMLLIIVLSNVSPVFLSTRNFINIFKQASITSILAIGMTFVLLSGGIDLSVGSVVALSGVIAASVGVSDAEMPVIYCFLAAISVGLFCGLLNGAGIAYVEFPPFIMTLGMMGIARGFSQVYTSGKPVFGVNEAFADVAAGVRAGIPNLVFFMLVVFIISLFVLTSTVFGRRVYAIGGNLDAARLSGVNVKLYTMFVYIICGGLAGLCGMLMASRITSGNPTAASSYEMDAIAAAVIGGVSMTGGYGSVTGTIVGAFILIIIQNGFDILGISPFYKQIVQGVIILFAVLIDIQGKKHK
jgi:ribose/xylose/arabinose/galactoside ABC-type transport system permease subunit